MSEPRFTKAEFETLSNSRYQLRCFLRLSEQLTRRAGITNLQYLLLLHIRGYSLALSRCLGEDSHLYQNG